MSPENTALILEEQAERERTALVRHRLEEQYADLDQQHATATLGMWVFLATEVMFFGALFLGVGVYRHAYPQAFEKASEKLNWVVGGLNTVVLLVSSLFMALAVHYARVGQNRRVVFFLLLTAALGAVFLLFKAYEYYTDYRDYLIPGWRDPEDPEGWAAREGLAAAEVSQVRLFLLFYWIMTGTHALHVTIGIAAVLIVAHLARRNHFSPDYYSPVDVTGLYWHFVDTVWIFLLPMLYLLGTHTPQAIHF